LRKGPEEVNEEGKLDRVRVSRIFVDRQLQEPIGKMEAKRLYTVLRFAVVVGKGHFKSNPPEWGETSDPTGQGGYFSRIIAPLRET